MSKYIREFLSLRCAPDILEALHHTSAKEPKEITESMAIISKVRPIFLAPKQPDFQWRVLDLCAGNALTGVLCTFLYKTDGVYAIDTKPRRIPEARERIQRFQYIKGSVFENGLIDQLITDRTILVSVHPCRQLAQQVVNIYNMTRAKALFMMPCCNGTFQTSQHTWRTAGSMIGMYEAWCLYLAEQCNGKLSRDQHCLSPKSIVISATKGV